MGKKLFVGGLSWDTDDQGLRRAFAQFGEISEAKVVTDRDTGRSRGFGFVEMGSDQEAQAAISALDGTMVEGRTIQVNVARPREGGAGGGGGGGGRGPGRGGAGGGRGGNRW